MTWFFHYWWNVFAICKWYGEKYDLYLIDEFVKGEEA